MLIDISLDGQIIAVGDSNRLVYLWQIATTQLLATFVGHTSWVWSVAFSHDGNMLASSGSDMTVRLWERNTGQCWQILTEYTGCVWSVNYSLDDQRLASGSSHQTIRLWDVATGEDLQVLRGHMGGVFSLLFTTDDQLRTTNYLERLFREFRTKSDKIGTFSNETSCLTVFWLVVELDHAKHDRRSSANNS